MEEQNSLVIFSKASEMLAQADTIQKTKDLKDLALTAADWARRKGMGEEAILYARSWALRAGRKMGELLFNTERASGARGIGKSGVVSSDTTPTLTELNISRDESSMVQRLFKLPEEKFEEVVSGEKTANRAFTETKQEENKKRNAEIEAGTIIMPEGKYSTIVIDPPWPMVKILREVRPNQAEFDYPTMSVEEIKTLPTEVFALDDCHLYLWTTQRFLPDAFDVLKAWGFTYGFTMVWHKSGGFQPVGLPQYNCEFVLFGRKGNLEFLDTKDFFCVFTGERREHSRKPTEFYNLVKRVSPAPYIDIFSREKHDGFLQWGKETERFQ